MYWIVQEKGKVEETSTERGRVKIYLETPSRQQETRVFVQNLSTFLKRIDTPARAIKVSKHPSAVYSGGKAIKRTMSIGHPCMLNYAQHPQTPPQSG